MKDYKRLTKNDWHNAKFDVAVNKEHRAILHRLWDIENRIESGEIDYVADKDKKIARLTAELDITKAALNNLIFYCTNDKKFMCEAFSEKCPKKSNGTLLCGGEECGKIMFDFYIKGAKMEEEQGDEE